MSAVPTGGTWPTALDLELLDPELVLRASGQPEGEGLFAELDTEAGGRHFVRLHLASPEGWGPLQLQVRVAP